jgi:hypothetical protein
MAVASSLFSRLTSGLSEFELQLYCKLMPVQQNSYHIASRELQILQINNWKKSNQDSENNIKLKRVPNLPFRVEISEI